MEADGRSIERNRRGAGLSIDRLCIDLRAYLGGRCRCRPSWRWIRFARSLQPPPARRRVRMAVSVWLSVRPTTEVVYAVLRQHRDTCTFRPDHPGFGSAG